MSRRTVAQWRREVFKAPISPNVRLLLIYMADHVWERNKHVSVPRSQMAAALGWSDQRVSERLREAVQHGFLYSKSPGYRGHTAEYQATFPDTATAESVRKNRTLSQPRKHGRYAPGKRPEGTDATTRAERSAGTHHRDVGSEERAEEQRVSASVTGCEWHDEASPCPEDCANHAPARRRTA